MTSFPNLVLATLILAVLQVLAAIPWFWALDGRSFRKWITDPKTLTYLIGAIIGLSLLLAWYLRFRSAGEVESLKWYGRIFGSLLHLQLILDFAILAPRFVLSLWPKGGAVALSAMRESIRQPMFWLITSGAALLIVISTFIPYFTLGEDYKLMKQVGYDAVMLFSALFGLLTASVSVNEEIEGRTAITVISKPVNRRQFLIGKYVGILLACWVMMLLLGWVLSWALHWKPRFDALDDAFDPMPVEVASLTSAYFDRLVPTPEASSFAQGMGTWVGETFAHHLGIFRVSGQVMIMLAICTALATRVQFVVNLVICLGIFLIGNLAPIMVHVTQNTGTDANAALQLVSFIAQLLSAVFPALNSFDMGPAIIRDSPLSTSSFSGFVLIVFLYALLYSVIVLLIGLLLFEDRDLA